MQILFKKIKDKVISKEQEEYDNVLNNLQKICGLSREQTEDCIRRLDSTL